MSDTPTLSEQQQAELAAKLRNSSNESLFTPFEVVRLQVMRDLKDACVELGVKPELMDSFLGKMFIYTNKASIDSDLYDVSIELAARKIHALYGEIHKDFGDQTFVDWASSVRFIAVVPGTEPPPQQNPA